MSGEYFEVRRVTYDCGDVGVAQFVPVCSKCARFVKADETLTVRGDGRLEGDNATCSRCGRTTMLSEGYF